MTSANSKNCILVVDDEADIRESLREAVEMVGCTALLAKDGRDALRVLGQHRPCLIILDLMMPNMTGAELLQEMRLQPDLAELPVIISTSAPAQAPAGVPVLPKPIDLRAFWARIRQNCDCSATP
ncbi:MAG TPA: response regulator [Polyangiaceae bacterium]|nr:response regulator [Polyangiaceae bacterium]